MHELMAGNSWKRVWAALAAFAAVLVAALATGAPASAVIDPPGEADLETLDYVPGEVVVGFTKGSGSGQIDSSLDAIDAEDSESVPGLPKTRVVEIDESDSVEAVADELDDQAGVRWAEPNYIVETQSLPNDPRLGLLWGLRNVGQNSKFNDPQTDPVYGKPRVDIGASSAWKKTTGGNRNIAIIDTGIEGSHPDLAPNLNRKLSRNFVPTPDLGDPLDWKVDPNAWADQEGHGTHVAGTVGAVGNNGLGVTGVNWRSRLVAIRVIGPDPDVNGTATVAAGYAYAGRKGIPIANVSLGTDPGIPPSQAVRDAIAGSADTLFVVAAGNESNNNDEIQSYPCDYDLPNLVCVGAINSRAGLAGFSNYGAENVDVGAPGVDIESTVPNGSVPLDVDFAKGIGNFDQTPYPWKVTQKPSNPRLTFDGRDGAVPAPVAEATATLIDPVDLSDQQYCRLDLGHLGYGSDLDLHGNQVFAVQWTVDGVPPMQAGIMDAESLQYLRDQNAYKGYSLATRLVGADGASNVQISVGFIANGTPSPLPSIEIGQMRVSCIAPMSPGGVYNAISGTSMASPHVAGVAGLVKSVAPKAGPEKLKKIIMQSVVPTKSLKGKTVTGGRVDAGRAVRFIHPAAKARLTGLKVSPKKLKLRPGHTRRLKVRVRNGGGAAAKRLRICLKAPRRYVKPAGCAKPRKLGSGKSTMFGFRVRLKGTARSGQSIRLNAIARARGTGNRNVSSRLKVVGPSQP
jgi:thermitase